MGSGGFEPQQDSLCSSCKIRTFVTHSDDTDSSLRSSCDVVRSGLGRIRTTDLGLVKATS